LSDETLQNSIKRKHPRKGEKMKQTARTTKVQASKQPKGKGTTKYQNLHQLREAYCLKKGELSPHKTPSPEEHFPAATARIQME
jgi:hypothetical protein